MIVVLFLTLIIGVLIISLLNHLGITDIQIDFEDMERRPPVGLTETEMQKLPVESYKSTNLTPNANDQVHEVLNTSKSEESDIMCSICYLNFKKTDQVIYLPECTHVFHSPCIQQWLKEHTTCPLCRIDIKRLVCDDTGNLNNDPNENGNVGLNRSLFEISDS